MKLRSRLISAFVPFALMAFGGCPESVTPVIHAIDIEADDIEVGDIAEDAVEAGLLPGPLDDVLRLNHLQALGTHNSYHQRPDPVLYESHDYQHLPIGAQLNMGVRAFEWDIHNPVDLVDADDYAIYHILGVDERASCPSLKACLQIALDWSNANPGHIPLVIWLEPKGFAGGGFIEDIQRLDAVISAVIPEEKLLTPARVQGAHATLRAALTDEGWPTLGQSRGTMMFCLLGTGERRDDYMESLPKTADRLLFVDTNEDEFGAEFAAVSKINNPGSASIPAAHAAHILVASNACLTGDDSAETCPGNRAAVATHGAHWLKTDHPDPAGGETSGLSLYFTPRCNPVTAPVECVDAAVEPGVGIVLPEPASKR